MFIVVAEQLKTFNARVAVRESVTDCNHPTAIRVIFFMQYYIYAIWLRGKIIYIGRTKNLRSRIMNHIGNSIGFPANNMPKKECLYSTLYLAFISGKYPKFTTLGVYSESDIAGKEKLHIQQHKPRYNNHGNGSICDYVSKKKKVHPNIPKMNPNTIRELKKLARQYYKL